jgi:hypothetical protein
MLGELFALTAWYILFSIWHKTHEFVDSVSYLVAMSLSPTCDVMSKHKYKFQYGRSSMLICVNSISNSSPCTTTQKVCFHAASFYDLLFTICALVR